MALKHLDFHITNNCNMNCIHCLYDSGVKKINELEYVDIKNVIDEFFVLSEGIGTINLFGGEIFTRKDIFQIIDLIKNNGLNFGITTNGNFNKNTFEKIIEIKPNRLSIDLDGGTRETHDWLRNKVGHFDKSIDMIKQFINANIPVSITTVLNKKNSKEISTVLNICKSLKVSAISFYMMTPLGRAKKLTDYILSGEEWLANKKCVLEWIENNEPKFQIIWEKSYINKNKLSSAKILCKNFFSEAINLKCNGDVYFCGLLTSVDASKIGNVKEQSLSNIIKEAYNKTTNMEGCFAVISNKKENNSGDIIAGCPYDWEQLNRFIGGKI